MMRRRAVSPGRLRRRLAVIFMLAVGISAAALAGGSYLLVRHNLLDDSVASGLRQTRRNLVLAGAFDLRRPAGTAALLAAYQRRGDFLTVGTTEGRRFSSSFSLGIRQVPEDLEHVVAGGSLGYERRTVGGTHYLIAGGPAGAKTQLYFFYPEDQQWHELAQLRNILLGGLGVVVLLAGLVGAVLARRTLRPVARASEAARSLAEGLLETRLPVEGRDEFGAWAESFNEMASALEGKISALAAARARERRFTADVAHELRTPLTALVGEASLLAEHLDRMPPEARRPAELLIADVGRMRRLVEDLMEISRFDAGQEDVRAEPVDLGSLAAAVLRGRGWEERVEIVREDVVLETDPRRLERIVANLVGNALDHGGRPVTVHVGRDALGAYVEVSDRGRGIPPDQVGHLFERFYKADPSRASRGSGLGLAIAQENAHLLGGDIEVWSELGAGTRFTLRLPVTEPLRSRDSAVAEPVQDGTREVERRPT